MADVEGVLVVDKEAGPTSHDIVNMVRRALGIKKVGHTGTLDPMATGVLVLCVGKATKISHALPLEPKEYVAEVKFGLTTDTQDSTGKPVSRRKCSFTEADLRTAMRQFVGEISQVPPMVSAVKVGGVPLYKLAREGKEVERRARIVEVFELEFVEFHGGDSPTAVLRIECSGGTYVRTLASDLGEALGCGAHVSALRRTRVGKFRVEEALSSTGVRAHPELVAANLISSQSALAG